MPKARAPKRKRALIVEVSTVPEESEAPSLRAPAAVVLAGLQRDTIALADRINSLTRRFTRSHGVLPVKALQLVGLAAAGREAAFDCGLMRSHLGKALEAGAEEARVRAAQLLAYVMLLEDEAEGGEEAGVEAAARALWSHHRVVSASLLLVAIQLDSASLLHAVEAAMRVRDGIDPVHCTVRGDGFKSYQKDEWDNRVRVCAVDAEGAVVESIEAGDLHAIVSGASACVTSVAAAEAGGIEVVYRVPEGAVEQVAVSVSVCGSMLPGSPWTVSPLLVDSVILASVAPAHRSAFLRELSEWLPSRAYSLLYRGSRDGMTAAAFHDRCDGRGPTLVLVQSKEGWVFGGYAGVSWESREADYESGVSKHVACPDAFVLSVVGPYSAGPVRFPVVKAKKALCCDATCGPIFSGGLAVRASSVSRHDQLDGVYCLLHHGGYQDVLGHEEYSLTGAYLNFPTEVEVFAVQGLETN